jgi:hypothetical protein
MDLAEQAGLGIESRKGRLGSGSGEQPIFGVSLAITASKLKGTTGIAIEKAKRMSDIRILDLVEGHDRNASPAATRSKLF